MATLDEEDIKKLRVYLASVRKQQSLDVQDSVMECDMKCNLGVAIGNSVSVAVFFFGANKACKPIQIKNGPNHLRAAAVTTVFLGTGIVFSTLALRSLYYVVTNQTQNIPRRRQPKQWESVTVQ
jgi:hypothetical protein